MKTFLLSIVCGLTFVAFSAGPADAACYKFSNAPSDVGVCVGKGSDSFDDRKKAKQVLKKALGKDPGNVSSHSSSCHSNSNKC